MSNIIENYYTYRPMDTYNTNTEKENNLIQSIDKLLSSSVQEDFSIAIELIKTLKPSIYIDYSTIKYAHFIHQNLHKQWVI